MLSLTPSIHATYGMTNHPDGVGLEIEAEGYRRLQRFSLIDWGATSDGSLRDNGVEFVSTVLDGMGGVRTAITELARLRSESFVDWRMTWRCGTHVHVSCTDMRIAEVISMMALYAAAEPGFFEISGEERNDNVFCVPWYHTPRNIAGAVDFMQQARSFPSRRQNFTRVLQAGNKYMALNMLPLRTLGTLEFRMAPGWDDLTRVTEFAGYCVGLRTLARELGNPDTTAEFLLDSGAQGVLDSIGMPVTIENCDMAEEALDGAFSIVGETPLRADDIDWSFPDLTEVEVPEEVSAWQRTAPRTAPQMPRHTLRGRRNPRIGQAIPAEDLDMIQNMIVDDYG